MMHVDLKYIWYYSYIKMLLICYGTRPEYIKVKSLIINLQNVKTLFTGQHTTLIGEHSPTYHIDMESVCENRLNNIVCSILKHCDLFFGINYVLVQGDTTSALAVALSAFHHNIKIIHLEAGLRTYDLYDPYPEEMNRQLISRMAYIHLCPTEQNKENLLLEQIKTPHIYIVGNTGLDNILKYGCEYTNTIIVTMHRRDNIEIMNEWFQQLNNIAIIHGELTFILPMHPNPEITKHKHLLTHIRIIPPQTHQEMINLIKKCKFLISDSGGLQEEASYLDKKIIVCRKTTERPETLGTTSVLCNHPKKLLPIFNEINDNYIVKYDCPYGNGNSWEKIKKIFIDLHICYEDV